jgi:hypothetical protein
MSVEVDHLVVAAHTLEQGVAWCEATLGVTPGPGGKHPLMGTHNRLLKVANPPRFPRTYLEIIAIDPEAPAPGRSEGGALPARGHHDTPAPGRARWFGLDDPALQRSLAESPRLLHWAGGTRNLDMHRWGLIAGGFNPGETLAASRDTPMGRLEWRIVVRDDGALLAGGTLPTLIEWHSVHPTDTMPDAGLVLQRLTLRGLPAQAAAVLQPRGIERAEGDGPAIEAVLQTPRGLVTLTSEAL